MVDRSTRKPDFAIIGAPRSATTSLASWLDHHPGAFISDPKEPFFFASEMYPNLRRSQGVSSHDHYARLFSSAPSDAVCGEASTLYLSSDRAIEELLAYAPGVKLIVVLRNPAEIARSFHQQMVLMGFEQRTFAAAWRASIAGSPAPATFADAALANYAQIASIGKQLEFVVSCIDTDSLLVVSFDELVADSRSSLADVAMHLGVSPMDTGLDRSNGSRRALGPIPRLLRDRRVRGLTRSIKHALPDRAVARLRRSRDHLLYEQVVHEHDSDLEDSVRSYFTDEVDLVCRITGGRATAKWGYS